MKNLKTGLAGRPRYDYAYGADDLGLGRRVDMKAPVHPTDRGTAPEDRAADRIRWGKTLDTTAPQRGKNGS